MWLETNASNYLRRDFFGDYDGWNKLTIPFQWMKWKISEILRRFKTGLAVMFKDEVYIPLDWEIMGDTIVGLADVIKKSVKEINNKKIEWE